MSDFTLYYWPVPFRGEFVRAVLAHCGATVSEPASDEVQDMMTLDPRAQPVPHMAPPMLLDNGSGQAVAQMPAICLWLGERFDLLPAEPYLKAVAVKIVNDTNDVLDEMTINGGKAMWTSKSWSNYHPRLVRWMRIWEAALKQDLLPEGQLGLPHIMTATLWGAMTERLSELRPLLDAEAPRLAELTDSVRSQPALAAQAQESRTRFGDTWCGGEIEKSLRQVIAG
ncbi:MAG: glutathione S-transferase [Alphaproteobacteria bacterium]|nr:glutathione S-transferase [Alphaproteobacteria bacterium]